MREFAPSRSHARHEPRSLHYVYAARRLWPFRTGTRARRDAPVTRRHRLRRVTPSHGFVLSPAVNPPLGSALPLSDGALALLDLVARALLIDLVVLDGAHKPRLVVNSKSEMFASPASIAKLVRRLAPHVHEAGIAIAHADPHVPDGAEVCAFRALDGLVLVATGPAHPRAPSIAGLVGLYGLTPTEARVAHLLAVELSPTEIACELGVELSTIRTHLRAIQSKLAAESQTDLVRRLLHSAAVLFRAELPGASSRRSR